jgi:7-cyano-7-deazaguanine synthase
VPKNRDSDGGIPITYVPARNTIFLSYALAWCEVLGAADIFIGANAIDYSGYPDCRPEFIFAFEQLAGVATKAGVEGARFHIHAPLISMSKADIIRKGTELGIDYALTHSCYDPTAEGLACGECDSCRLRLAGFRDAGLVDPARYAEK